MFRVKELAQARGLTQEALSRRANVPISTVRRIWQNSRAGDPRGGTLLAIAEVLGVSINDLYAIKDSTEESQSAEPDAILGNKPSLVYQGLPVNFP
jgi:transcriptional regulator with XRE-family HTH domain